MTNKPLYRKNDSTLIKRKSNGSFKGSKGFSKNTLTNNKSYTNVLMANDYSRSSYLWQQPSFDIVGLKKPVKNISPSKIINIKNQDIGGMASQDLKLSNTSDLRKLHELRQGQRGYTDLHQDKMKNSYVNYNLSKYILFILLNHKIEKHLVC